MVVCQQNLVEEKVSEPRGRKGKNKRALKGSKRRVTQKAGKRRNLQNSSNWINHHGENKRMTSKLQRN